MVDMTKYAIHNSHKAGSKGPAYIIII